MSTFFGVLIFTFGNLSNYLIFGWLFRISSDLSKCLETCTLTLTLTWAIGRRQSEGAVVVVVIVVVVVVVVAVVPW